MLAVLKYGGNAMAQGGLDPVLSDLAGLLHEGWQFVLVHGGGPEIDAALAESNIQTTRVNGLRVSDSAALTITERVLCGSVNKRLVRGCAQLGIAAVGVSGQDGALLSATKSCAPDGSDLGFVGEIQSVDPRLLLTLLDAGYVPVVAPLALASDHGCAYNVNADTAAGAIASALRADVYIVVSNIDYVLADPNDPSSAIHAMSLHEACAFAASPACASGMKPKMDAVIGAIKKGVDAAVICGGLRQGLAGAGTLVRG